MAIVRKFAVFVVFSLVLFQHEGLCQPTSSSTVGPPLGTSTRPPKLEIKCLNNDCDSSQKKTTTKPSGAGLIAANMVTGANPEDVTSVPKKGVDNLLADSAPSVPKKGVAGSDHLTQSAKKELKDLATSAPPQLATAPSTTISTTPVTPSKTPLADQSAINKTKSSNLNAVPTPNTTIVPRNKPLVTKDELDFLPKPPDGDQSPSVSTSLVVGLVFGLVLMTVLFFVGLKRIESIRRRREYRRMNDFLIDGMYNDL